MEFFIRQQAVLKKRGYPGVSVAWGGGSTAKSQIVLGICVIIHIIQLAELDDSDCAL